LSCCVQYGAGKGEKNFVKFCFKLGKTAPETHNMLHEAYSNDALNQTMIHEWFKYFKYERTPTAVWPTFNF
jgi:hypothetical protein